MSVGIEVSCSTCGSVRVIDMDSFDPPKDHPLRVLDETVWT
jgi:hypothetical protein